MVWLYFIRNLKANKLYLKIVFNKKSPAMMARLFYCYEGAIFEINLLIHVSQQQQPSKFPAQP